MTIRHVFGDDIFISYARRDSSTYASGLASELAKRGFSCFIDRLGTEANPELPESLRRRLRGCSMLVVIATSWSGTRDSIKDEIVEFKLTKRPIIPVDIDGTIFDATWYGDIQGIAPEPEKNPQALDDGNPSAAVISRIEKAFKYRRRNDRLRRLTIGTAAVLLLLLVLSGYSGRKATIELARAQQARLRADKAVEHAKQQEMIAGAKTKEAQLQSEIADRPLDEARRRQQEAATQRAAAKRQSKVSFALSLASEARKVYEAEPMLGLRLSLEALSQAPEDDKPTRARVEESIRSMTAQGRVRKLGSDDVEKAYFIENCPVFVLVRVSGRSELRRSDSGDLVQQLPRDVVFVRQFAKSEPISYFMVAYEREKVRWDPVEGEVRRADTGEVVVSGRLGLVDNYFSRFPFVQVSSPGTPDQLLPTDHPGMPIKLSHRDSAISMVKGVPWMLVSYGEDRETELRQLDGRIAKTYSPAPGRAFGLSTNYDKSLFCVKTREGANSLPLSGHNVSAELRRADSGALIPLPDNAQEIFFSPSRPYFVVAYADRPAEIRRPDSNEIIPLPKTVDQAVFSPYTSGLAVKYIDGSSEIRREPKAESIALPDKFSSFNTPIVPFIDPPDDGSSAKRASIRTGMTAVANKQILSEGPVESKFFIVHVDAEPGYRYELHLKDSGELIPLPAKVRTISFVADAPYVLIEYEGGSCELRGNEIRIPTAFTPTSERKDRATVKFSPNQEMFVIYDSYHASLYHANGKEVKQVTVKDKVLGSIKGVVFSPDSTRLVVLEEFRNTKLLRTDTGDEVLEIPNIDLTQMLNAGFPGAIFNKLSKSFAFHIPGSWAWRRADNGDLIAPQPDGPRITSLRFSDEGSYAVLTYDDNRSELWNASGIPFLAAELERNMAGLRFDETNKQLITWHSDKRAYIFDLTWISEIAHPSGRAPFGPLLQSSCKAYERHPVPNGILERYLVGTVLPACQ